MARLKILAVCGMGLGSSTILRMQAEKAARALGLDASVEAADISSASQPGVDIIITSPALAGQLAHTRARVITIQNYMSLAEMTEKLKAAAG